MKTLRKAVRYVLEAIADIVTDEPLLVGAAVTVAATWAVAQLGWSLTTVHIVQGAILAFITGLARNYVTPTRNLLVQGVEAQLDKVFPQYTTTQQAPEPAADQTVVVPSP